MPIIATYRAPLVLEHRYDEPRRAHTYVVCGQALAIWVEGLSDHAVVSRSALTVWRDILKRRWLTPHTHRALLDVLEAHHHAYRP